MALAVIQAIDDLVARHEYCLGEGRKLGPGLAAEYEVMCRYLARNDSGRGGRQ